MSSTDFAEALKAIRKSRGLSQEALAELLGTTKQVISRYERGERVPKLSVAVKYAEILGVSLETLNGGKPRREPTFTTIAFRGKPDAEWAAMLKDIEHSRALGAQDEDESIIIETYRALTDEQKKAFKRFLKFIKEENDT